MRILPGLIAAGMLSLAGATGASGASRCVDCHVAIPGPAAVASHVAGWQHSKHGELEVGCERCHGGDPAMAEAKWAHRGVLHSSLPWSPVNRASLVRTCAPCHTAQAAAFTTSLHRVLLDADDMRAPSCATCHGAMDVRVPVPEVLEATCAGCHPLASPRGGYPGAARAGIAEIGRIRATLADVSATIAVVDDVVWRRELRTSWDAANQATVAAVTAFHAFDQRGLTGALNAARERTDGLVHELER